ncbi:MAG: DUF3363 domain-containing protein, partial [Polyangiaceae bacterium]
MRAESFEEGRPGEKRQYRLIVSPEDAGELDLTAYVRSYLARVEQDLGQPLEWAAVNHYDTAHPHVHIVLRGVDAHGQELRIDREYISNGLRWRAQELATLELGPRTELEVQRARTKEITQERYTSLDRELGAPRPGGRGHPVQSRRSHGPWGIDNSTLLGQLETFRLAERTSATSWAPAEGWAGQLKEMGTRGDVIKQMHVALRGDPARYWTVGPEQTLDRAPSDPPGPPARLRCRKGPLRRARGGLSSRRPPARATTCRSTRAPPTSCGKGTSWRSRAGPTRPRPKPRAHRPVSGSCSARRPSTWASRSTTAAPCCSTASRSSP